MFSHARCIPVVEVVFQRGYIHVRYVDIDNACYPTGISTLPSAAFAQPGSSTALARLRSAYTVDISQQNSLTFNEARKDPLSLTWSPNSVTTISPDSYHRLPVFARNAEMPTCRDVCCVVLQHVLHTLCDLPRASCCNLSVTV